MAGRPEDQQDPRPATEDRWIEYGSEADDRQQNSTDCRCMAEGDGSERQNDNAPTLAMKPEGDGKQPSHRRVQAMEGTETGNRHPGPESG
jgi:hypothetical protein